jgi:hypothetical protein
MQVIRSAICGFLEEVWSSRLQNEALQGPDEVYTRAEAACADKLQPVGLMPDPCRVKTRYTLIVKIV